MIVVAGGDVVLPDRILPRASLVVEHGHIAAIESGRATPRGAACVEAHGRWVVPGFIDVHVHGVDGYDTLDSDDPVAAMAARLPRYGVTAFCPTTVACRPRALRAVLECVGRARGHRPRASARVLPAHLESNFINPEYGGAQPRACLRSLDPTGANPDGDFTGADILDVIAACQPEVGIITVAPEVPGILALVPNLVRAGHRVSLGHSGADFETAIAAIDAGARQATHLFNRMAPLSHRSPGIAGAVLSRDDVCAEIICDGHHVHPAMGRVAIAAKGARRVMAITDGTAASGLPWGSAARLGGRTIRAARGAAVLEDGTLAGGVLTMDQVFRALVTLFRVSLPEASTMCSTTPGLEMGLSGTGAIAVGAVADLVVLDRDCRVVATIIDGDEVYRAG